MLIEMVEYGWLAVMVNVKTNCRSFASYVLNCAGQAKFTGAVRAVGTDEEESLNQGSYRNKSCTFVAASAGAVSSARTDGAASEATFNWPVDALGDVNANGNLTKALVEVNQVQSVAGSTLWLQIVVFNWVSHQNWYCYNADMYLDTSGLIVRILTL